MTNVLVVVAHPDDEILGVGGTVKRHTLAGDHVHSLVMCEGESLRYEGKDVRQERFGSEAAEILGTSIEFLRFPDQRLETVVLTDLIGEVERAIKQREPQIIYTQFGGDINLDHGRVFDAVLVAARPMQPTVRAVYAFETCSSTEWAWPQKFNPDTFVDISETLEAKIEAMSRYCSEVCDWPHPRSLESLRHRAAYFGSIACMEAAEPFITVRRYRRPGEAL